MFKTYYRIWLPISLLVHLVLFLVLRHAHLSSRQVKNPLIPIIMVQETVTPEPAKPPVTPAPAKPAQAPKPAPSRTVAAAPVVTPKSTAPPVKEAPAVKIKVAASAPVPTPHATASARPAVTAPRMPNALPTPQALPALQSAVPRTAWAEQPGAAPGADMSALGKLRPGLSGGPVSASPGSAKMVAGLAPQMGGSSAGRGNAGYGGPPASTPGTISYGIGDLPSMGAAGAQAPRGENFDRPAGAGSGYGVPGKAQPGSGMPNQQAGPIGYAAAAQPGYAGGAALARGIPTAGGPAALASSLPHGGGPAGSALPTLTAAISRIVRGEWSDRPAGNGATGGGGNGMDKARPGMAAYPAGASTTGAQGHAVAARPNIANTAIARVGMGGGGGGAPGAGHPAMGGGGGGHNLPTFTPGPVHAPRQLAAERPASYGGGNGGGAPGKAMPGMGVPWRPVITAGSGAVGVGQVAALRPTNTGSSLTRGSAGAGGLTPNAGAKIQPGGGALPTMTPLGMPLMPKLSPDQPGGGGSISGVGGTLTLPSLEASIISGLNPSIPKLALKEDIFRFGPIKIVIAVKVDSAGNPREVTFVKHSKYNMLDNEVQRIARKRHYNPALKDGAAVESVVQLRFIFSENQTEVKQL